MLHRRTVRIWTKKIDISSSYYIYAAGTYSAVGIYGKCQSRGSVRDGTDVYR